MAKNWALYPLLAAGLLLSLSNCGFFHSEKVSFNDEPVITTTNLSEIKEVVPLDEYGFKEHTLLDEGWVKRNESLYIILSKYDVNPQTIYELTQETKGIYNARSLKQGQHYLVYEDPVQNKATRMILHLNTLEYVVFDWADKVWVTRGEKEITRIVQEASGVITSSLYQSLKDQNVNTLLGGELSDIFGWQIDFFILQKNDSYKVIYEQPYVDGEPYGVGHVLAASFQHKGREYDAYYYESTERAGYFDEEGKGLQKALLKAPFKYNQRISSGFSHNRFHPVLGRNMPHYGVDYAAPLGTPVIAVGDGEVVEARYRGANGNIVKIKHNSVYTTAYLHLNGFASGIRSGTRVKQGQVIGYVGRTGRVTGVHLDYRIYKNNKPVNPLNVDLPPSKALAGDELGRFKLYIERYRFQLNQVGVEQLLAEAK